MGCAYVGKAIRIDAQGNRQVIRLCMAIPRERESDPEEMPPSWVCFSATDYTDCYHYKVMIKRGEPPVEQPEEDTFSGLQPFELDEDKPKT